MSMLSSPVKNSWFLWCSPGECVSGLQPACQHELSTFHLLLGHWSRGPWTVFLFHWKWLELKAKRQSLSLQANIAQVDFIWTVVSLWKKQHRSSQRVVYVRIFVQQVNNGGVKCFLNELVATNSLLHGVFKLLKYWQLILLSIKCAIKALLHKTTTITLSTGETVIIKCPVQTKVLFRAQLNTTSKHRYGGLVKQFTK